VAQEGRRCRFEKGQGWPPPRLISDSVQDRVLALRHEGRTWPQIAAELERHRIRNSLGRTDWSVGSLRALAARHRAQPLSAHPELMKLRRALETTQEELAAVKAALRDCREEQRR